MMNKVERLEDYTNAVIVIVITLMVLDIHAPAGHFFSDILRANDHFLTYVYSSLLISMYWVNHGRLFSGLKHLKITPQVSWANSIFLPFASSWLTRNISQRDPEMFYAAIMLCIDLSYYLLMRLCRSHFDNCHQSFSGRNLGNSRQSVKVKRSCDCKATASFFKTPE